MFLFYFLTTRKEKLNLINFHTIYLLLQKIQQLYFLFNQLHLYIWLFVQHDNIKYASHRYNTTPFTRVQNISTTFSNGFIITALLICRPEIWRIKISFDLLWPLMNILIQKLFRWCQDFLGRRDLLTFSHQF